MAQALQQEYDFEWYEGDRLPILEATLYNPAAPGAAKTATNLTSAASIKFQMHREGSSDALVIDSAGTIVTPSAGTVSHSRSAPEATAATRGDYRGTFEVTWNSGLVQHIPTNEMDFLWIKVNPPVTAV